MYIICPYCQGVCESECEVSKGQHVLCPYCNVKFTYGEPQDNVDCGESVNEQGKTTLAVCPYCGFGEPVEEEYIGRVGVCPKCHGKFTIIPNSKGVPFKEPPAEVRQPNDDLECVETARAVPSKGMGCLTIFLVSFAVAFCSTYFNYGAVALSAGAMLIAILIYLRNREIGKCGHVVPFSRIVQRFGGVWVLPATYVVLFVLFSLEMNSCYSQQQESAKASAIRNAQIKKDGGYWIVRKCPDCRNEIHIFKKLENDGSYAPMLNGTTFMAPSPNDWRYHVRCDNCGRYVDLGFHP